MIAATKQSQCPEHFAISSPHDRSERAQYTSPSVTGRVDRNSSILRLTASASRRTLRTGRSRREDHRLTRTNLSAPLSDHLDRNLTSNESSKLLVRRRRCRRPCRRRRRPCRRRPPRRRPCRRRLPPPQSEGAASPRASTVGRYGLIATRRGNFVQRVASIALAALKASRASFSPRTTSRGPPAMPLCPPALGPQRL